MKGAGGSSGGFGGARRELHPQRGKEDLLLRAMRIGVRLGGLALGVVGLSAVGAGSAAVRSVASAAPCDWHLQHRVKRNEFTTGLAVAGPRDVWVGVANSSRDWLMHWDGSRWSRFRIPQPFGGATALRAASPHEVWTVDYGGGAARWRDGRVDVVPTPLSDYRSQLWALSSDAAADVWASGWRISDDAGHPLVEHWNGKRWTVSFTENAYGGVTDVLALSPRDVWGVGWHRFSPRGDPNLERPLVIHWNGRRWRACPRPVPRVPLGVPRLGLGGGRATRRAWRAVGRRTVTEAARELAPRLRALGRKPLGKRPRPEGRERPVFSSGDQRSHRAFG
jgi:hypothetical protein